MIMFFGIVEVVYAFLICSLTIHWKIWWNSRRYVWWEFAQHDGHSTIILKLQRSLATSVKIFWMLSPTWVEICSIEISRCHIILASSFENASFDTLINLWMKMLSPIIDVQNNFYLLQSKTDDIFFAAIRLHTGKYRIYDIKCPGHFFQNCLLQRSYYLKWDCNYNTIEKWFLPL